MMLTQKRFAQATTEANAQPTDRASVKLACAPVGRNLRPFCIRYFTAAAATAAVAVPLVLGASPTNAAPTPSAAQAAPARSDLDAPLPAGLRSDLALDDVREAMNPANPFNGGVDPIAMPGDARLVVFTYNRDQIFRVLTAPLKMTTIEFPPDEAIVGEPAWGESVRWDYETDGRNHLYLKPQAAGLVNTLSVNTNKRSYEFTLVSSPIGGIFYQKVRMRLPSSMADKRGGLHREAATPARSEAGKGTGKGEVDGILRDDPFDAVALASDDRDTGQSAVPLETLNFAYKMSGEARFRPDIAFDDGKALWLRIPDGAPWPVALVKDGSDFVVANFLRRGKYLVVQHLAPVTVLRAGDDEVRIEPRRSGWFGLY